MATVNRPTPVGFVVSDLQLLVLPMITHSVDRSQIITIALDLRLLHPHLPLLLTSLALLQILALYLLVLDNRPVKNFLPATGPRHTRRGQPIVKVFPFPLDHLIPYMFFLDRMDGPDQLLAATVIDKRRPVPLFLPPQQQLLLFLGQYDLVSPVLVPLKPPQLPPLPWRPFFLDKVLFPFKKNLREVQLSPFLHILVRPHLITKIVHQITSKAIILSLRHFHFPRIPDLILHHFLLFFLHFITFFSFYPLLFSLFRSIWYHARLLMDFFNFWRLFSHSETFDGLLAHIQYVMPCLILGGDKTVPACK